MRVFEKKSLNKPAGFVPTARKPLRRGNRRWRAELIHSTLGPAGADTGSRHRGGANQPTGNPALRGPLEMIEFLMIPGAPTPVAPFSHATALDGWIFVTGQLPIDPSAETAPLPEGIEAQTRQV